MRRPWSRDLCGVQAQVASSAEQAVRVRQAGGGADGEVDAALADGAADPHLGDARHAPPADPGGLGPAFLSLMAAGRPWAAAVVAAGLRVSRRSRSSGCGSWSARRCWRAARSTREELIAAVVAHEGTDHLGDALRSGWGTLLKPIAWQGDLCHGPMRGRNVTFQHPSEACRRLAGHLGP